MKRLLFIHHFRGIESEGSNRAASLGRTVSSSTEDEKVEISVFKQKLACTSGLRNLYN